MKSREYVSRYLYLYCYAVSLCLLLGTAVTDAVAAVSSRQALAETPVVVIDAGHGGIDGGATSCTGILERTFNLEIAGRLEDLLHFLGRQTVMTRTDDRALSTEGTTIREQKRSDLRNRAALVNRYPRAVLISIHQNQYPDPRYAGPQVFYSATDGSREMALQLQEELNALLAPQSRRAAKPSEGVYLLRHVRCPAVLVECGFLSSPVEEARLRSRSYQQKLCCILARSALRPLDGTDS